jgi:hypothetical protein
MSSLSSFARGGAVDSGTASTMSPGSHQGASSSFLPTFAPRDSGGVLGMSGEVDDDLLGIPSLTAGGPRTNSMSTPRQLDNFMHGVDANQDDLTTGEWNDTGESITGSMGGESKGVVRVFIVEKGAGKDFCCGTVGGNGARFCTSHPVECGYKSHVDKKADIKPGHVYLGSDSGKKSAGWTSWCMPVSVFGGRESQLSALNLNGPQFRRFGETLQGIFSGGKVNMSSVSWDPILEEINRPLDYGGTPRKVQFRKHEGGPLESTGLSNWMTLATPDHGDSDGEDRDGLVDTSTEDDYRLIEKMTNMTANAEVLKAAIEHLSVKHGKTSEELGDIVMTLSSQIHDVSVRLGNNPGFVGSAHDSVWNGITLVNDKMERSEKKNEKRVELLVKDSIRHSVKDHIDSFLSGGQIQALIAQEVAKTKQTQEHRQERTEGVILALKEKVQLLESKNMKLDEEVVNLGRAQKPPTNFAEDWKLVFDFFIRNTKPANPPKVGGILEDSITDNTGEIQRLAADLRRVSMSPTGSAPSLSSRLHGERVTPSQNEAKGTLATVEAQVLDLQARLESKAVTIENFTFPTLAGTTKWAVANLPSSSEKALVCVDVVALLHSIGREFATVDETRDTMYQNKRAGVSSMAITVSSSFQTVLPQIMGKASKSNGEDTGLTLPCASKYSEWFDNSVGMATGVKPRIQDGLATQKAVYEEAIRELACTHPAGAAMASKLLQRSFDFATLLLAMMETMWNEYAGRSGDVQPTEAWMIICAVVRQVFREFRNVRRPGAAVVPGSATSIGTTWWYVLQTHRLMDEFAAVDIRRHHSIIPVFTSHLDRHRVSKSTHATLVTQVKKVEQLVSTLSTSVNRLNGARGNGGGRGAGGRGAADDV